MAAVNHLKIVYRDPKDLVAYERNTRTHSTDQIAKIASAIKEFGFTNPVLLKDDEETIGAGHARTRAAILAGLASVPTITLSGLTEDQWRAYVIADNQLAVTGSGWDMDMLKLEMGQLQLGGFDLSLTGFDMKFINGLLPVDNEGETDPDDAGVLNSEVITVLGDVWLLGDHRLVCGDSTIVDDVDKALNGVTPGLMVTDPPYGVNYDGAKRAEGFKDGSNRATGMILNDDRADWREAWALFPGAVAYVWHAYKTATVVDESLVAAGYNVRSQIVWVKDRAVQSPKNMNPKTMGYNPGHECCFYAVKNNGKPDWFGDASQSTVWDDIKTTNDTGHGSQKPVECMKRPILNNSSPGQAVYEPFSGSGTTIIACEITGRHCHAIELSPNYVDMAVARWQRFTGKTAVLEETGQTFAEVLAMRNPSASFNIKVKAPAKPKREPKVKP